MVHADLDEAIRLAPKDPAAHVLRAQLHLANRLLQQTEAACMAAVKVDPNCTEAYFVRALCQLEENRLADALAELTKTIDLDPQHAEALFLRGTIYTERGELQKAKQDLDRAFKLRPDLLKRIPPLQNAPPRSRRSPAPGPVLVATPPGGPPHLDRRQTLP
jgi:tetratricopeptide (TPR) repeat protein